MTGPHQRPPHVPPPYQQQPYQAAGYPPPAHPVPVPAPKRRRAWPWVVGILVVLFVIGLATGGHRSTGATGPQPGPTVAADTTAAQPAPAAPAGPATAIGDGTYQVGVDMVPGRYKTPGPPSDAIVKDCYWERTKNDSGQFDSIIANGNATGPGSVTVKQGEFFHTSGGCTWTKQ